MYYFKQTERGIEKYRIDYPSEKVRELKLKIMHDCNEIVLRKQMSSYSRIYEAYHFPYLVSLIDRLLQEDATVLEEIWHPNMEKERSILSGDGPVLSTRDLAKQQLVFDYYPMLQNLIIMTLVDQISYEEVNRVNAFFERSPIYKENEETQEESSSKKDEPQPSGEEIGEILKNLKTLKELKKQRRR